MSENEVQYPWVDNPTKSGVAICDTDILNNCLMHLKYDKKDGAGFNLFDTKISDYILEGNEAKGWALQGTYVTKESYPDFYNKCLEEKNAGVENETTLGDSSFMMYVNSNGHQFFNIADKSIIDEFYNTYGIADFYGIDTENERVFLPRNKYFHQLTDDVSKVNQMVEAGLPNITGGFTMEHNSVQTNGAFYNGGTVSGKQGGSSGDTDAWFNFDASRSSSIYGNSDTVQVPSSLKLLYYCVGNTEVTNAITNVAEITTSKNDTIPLFSGMYFDFKPNNASWLKAGVQQASAGIYTTCYNTLVEIVNGINNYDLKVINIADMLADVDYSEYWILDQDNLTFRTPLTIATKSLSGAVAGNGMTLGLTDGANNVGVFLNSTSDFGCRNSAYGANVGTGSLSGTTFTESVSYGVTTDETNSGLIAKESSAQLYFKVANAVQNLELLNAGEVLEAVNSVIPNNSSLIVNYGLPSDEYISLTVGASGSSYVMSENGYLTISFKPPNDFDGSQSVTITNKTLGDFGATGFNIWGRDTLMFLPVRKNDEISLTYSGITFTSFKLYKLKGEV